MNAAERRERPRIRFEATVAIHLVTPSKSGNIFEVKGHPISVQASDINESGMCLLLEAPVAPQTILKVDFDVAGKPVDVYARVVWANRDRCGLRFIVLDRICCRAIREYIEMESN